MALLIIIIFIIIKIFTNAAVLPEMKTSTRSALTLEAIKNSYEIYKQRNSATTLETNPTPGECCHCGLVVSTPAWYRTGCEFDSWQCPIYIPIH